MRATLYLFLFFLIFSCSRKEEAPQKKLPNILLIVADDLGYADLGSFGGNIETPNLDQLSAEGIRFSRFHTAPFCAVTRAMLLTGNYSHVAGMGSQDLVSDVPGYEGKLSDRVIPLPSLLQEAGYHTYIAGKWHLGLTEEANPANKGFENSFVTLEGGANHYSSRGIFPETPESIYTENGVETNWPEGAYSTDLYTDKLLEYISSNLDDQQPFFAFAAYTSPHWPLQVDEKYWKKYKGKFDAGYEQLRADRLESLKEAGMIPSNSQVPPLHPAIKPWNSLSAEEQKKEARKMELYAGMVDNLDENIGRLFSFLKEKAAYENTLIIFMTDNGAAGEDFFYSDYFGPFLKEYYTDEYSQMGKENSFISYGPQWAEAGSSPFYLYKGFTSEGGMTAPLIISGSPVNLKGKIHDSFLSVMDIAPTIYDLAGITYPDQFQEKAVQKPVGESILPILKNEKSEAHDSTYVFALEHRGYAMLRKGKWKLLNLKIPFERENFGLYDLENDLIEQNDLKNTFPEKYQELLKDWDTWSKKVGVQTPTPQPKK